MRWTMFAVLVAALALVGAGCGGGDDESAADTDTAVVTDTSTTETTTEETTTEETAEETDTDTSGSGSLGNCLEAVTAFGALSQAVASAGSSGDAEDSARVFQEYADNAPEEIRDDIRVLAAAYSEYIAKLVDLGLQPGDTPSADQIQEIAQAAEAFNSAEVQEASTNFSTWASANCPSG